MAGTNKMSELISLTSNHLRASPMHDNIFLDISNAFNECNREVASREIIRKCPRLARLFNLFYQDDSDEWESDKVTSGCVQGCYMGPLTFAFATLSLYEEIKDNLANKGNAFFAAYSDDSFIGANHEDAVEAFEMFIGLLDNYHLRLNFRKTVVMLGKCNDMEELQDRISCYINLGISMENIKLHPDNLGQNVEYGYTYLGVPVGSKEFCEKRLIELISDFEKSCKRDEIVSNAQQKWVYLLWCVRQKFPFWFKHMCPSITLPLLPMIESILKDKFEQVADFSVSDKVWNQICLPIKSHGCGLGKPVDTIAAAFVAHVEETLEAVTSVITAPYLEYFDIRFEIPPDFEFPSEDVENVVTQYRELKSKIVNVANDMGDAIDEDRAKDLRGKRNFSTIILPSYPSMRLISMKIKSESMVPLMIKQEHSVTTEVLQVLGFVAFRQKTRDKWAG